MKLKPIKWVDAKYGFVYGYVDGVRLFSAGYDACKPRSAEKDETPFQLGVELPGKWKSFRFATMDEAKEFAPRVLEHFLNKMIEKEDGENG